MKKTATAATAKRGKTGTTSRAVFISASSTGRVETAAVISVPDSPLAGRTTVAAVPSAPSSAVISVPNSPPAGMTSLAAVPYELSTGEFNDTAWAACTTDFTSPISMRDLPCYQSLALPSCDFSCLDVGFSTARLAAVPSESNDAQWAAYGHNFDVVMASSAAARVTPDALILEQPTGPAPHFPSNETRGLGPSDHA
ncbi:hypothetical protein B0H17DRAFT_1208505 [Mycena rosella]|uniref:Uncharacterized protein n=1 Tax=Mycena rosella TaxID=1033263 RepID=A0AAD7D0Y7_MYCRO|nr:hypothetical protein B0H17DRAFT_1208505 [Mycena rosella]